MKWLQDTEIRKRAMLLTVILVVFGGLGLWKNLGRGIYMGDVFLQQKSGVLYRSKGNEISMEKEDTGADFDITLKDTSQSARLDWSGKNHAVITFEDGNVVEGDWESSWGGDGELIDEEGFPIWVSDDMAISFDDDFSSISYGTLGAVLCRMFYGSTETRGSLWIVLVSAVIYIIGALSFLFPNAMHFGFFGWMYEKPQLSEEGIALEQIGAVILMLVGIGVMFYPVFSSIG